MGRSLGEAVAMDVLDSMLVLMQDEDHGTTGPGHEDQTHNIT